ncbi:MAG: helix-turn-helix domain-containing protein [Candidatus Micrarchaeaceae archaeon]
MPETILEGLVMEQPEQEANQGYQHTDAIDVEGIEIFGSQSGFGKLPGSYQQPTNTLPASLSIKDAAKFLRVSSNTIRARIKSGELSAGKVKGKTGEQWRVFIGNPPEGYQDHTNTSPESLSIHSSTELSRLLDLVEKQSARLEAASGQIGYLKSQLEERVLELQTSHEQIKLLTDSQYKAGRWRSFWRWLLGNTTP